MKKQKRSGAFWHITFHPYRRCEALVSNEVEEYFYQLVRDVEARLGFSVVKVVAMPEHVHLLLEMPPWLDVVDVIGQIKGYTARRLLERYPEFRFDTHSPRFWASGYHYVKHSRASLAAVACYIDQQKVKGGLE